MATSLDDREWSSLLRRIQSGRCTPFIGAGACVPTLPSGSEIAGQWAREYRYPLTDNADLARVAQFVAIEHGDPLVPKEELLDRLVGIAPPDFSESNNPHGLLADLPLSTYITTNYDDFMSQALRSRGKEPRSEVCRWNEYLRGQMRDQPSVFSEPGYTPTCARPIVFHLHGHASVPESIVLTEDDYISFLVSMWRDQELLPPRIQRAMTGASLLFIGYSMQDWTFRVLFGGLVGAMERSLRRVSVAVQLPPEASSGARHNVQNYLTRYFHHMNVRVYWGTAADFAVELRHRWKDLVNAGQH